ASRWRSRRSLWRTGPSSHASPSHSRSRSSSSSPPGTLRAGSVSSIRSSSQSPSDRAATALSALPTCNEPVGLGAKRVRLMAQNLVPGECRREDGVTAAEERRRAERDRELRRDPDARVGCEALLPIPRRNVDVQTGGRQLDARRVAVEVRAAARGLADEDGARAPLEVGDEVLGRREGAARDQDDEPPGPVDGLRAEHGEQWRVGVIVAARVEADVDDYAPHPLLPRESQDAPRLGAG